MFNNVKSITVPYKPSDILQLALDDMKAVSKLPNYDINMSYWLLKERDICNVCMAGSILVNTFKIGENVDCFSSNDINAKLGPEWYNAFYFIDQFRSGKCSVINVSYDATIEFFKSSVNRYNYNDLFNAYMDKFKEDNDIEYLYYSAMEQKEKGLFFKYVEGFIEELKEHDF